MPNGQFRDFFYGLKAPAVSTLLQHIFQRTLLDLPERDFVASHPVLMVWLHQMQCILSRTRRDFVVPFLGGFLMHLF